MAKFLIIRFSSIGDIIQCMNVVNGIKNHFPDAEIHWIARKDMGSFLNMASTGYGDMIRKRDSKVYYKWPVN